MRNTISLHVTPCKSAGNLQFSFVKKRSDRNNFPTINASVLNILSACASRISIISWQKSLSLAFHNCRIMQKTVFLHITPCKGAGNLQFSFVKKRSDRYNVPTINASVLNILLACTSRISIISWQKSLSLAFHNCRIMQKTVFLHVTPCRGAGNLQFSFVKKRSDRYNFPTFNASVLNILLACTSRISIISWQKSLSLAFHNCRIMQKTVFLHVTPCRGAGNLQFSFVKKRSDRNNFPTINASVLNILLACTSRISIISWQKSLSLAFHNCRIMQKTVFLHVTPWKGAGNLQFSFVKKRSDRYNFPTINASVLNILLACASRVSIISWQKWLSLAFHNCRIMPKTVFLHVTPYALCVSYERLGIAISAKK